MEHAIDLALILLLVATLFHALRLERALGMLKRDRAALEALVAAFNQSSQQAELGIERLRQTAEGAGRQLTREIERGGGLKDDLLFLVERAERMADRLEAALRNARAIPLETPPEPVLRAVRLGDDEPVLDEPRSPLRSQAERDLLKALRGAR